VRGVLLPAALALLGDRTWYAPRWLRRRAELAG
jgi:RND superfamily putative drug exporter